MKQIGALFVVICFCIISAIKTGAQNNQTPNPLSSFVGEWRMKVSTVGEGQMGMGEIASGELNTVAHPDSNTVSFSVSTRIANTQKGVPSFSRHTYAFSLKYDSSSKTYLLTVKDEDGLTVENLPLTFNSDSGFSGEGIAAIGNKKGKINVRITKDKEGRHVWYVSGDGCGGLEEINIFSVRNVLTADTASNLGQSEMKIGCIKITFSKETKGEPVKK